MGLGVVVIGLLGNFITDSFFFSHLLFFCVYIYMEKGKTVSGTNGVRFDRGWNVAMAWLGLLRLFPFFPLVRESGNLWHLVGISGLEIVLECLSIAREVLIASNVRYLASLFFLFILFYIMNCFILFFFSNKKWNLILNLIVNHIFDMFYEKLYINKKNQCHVLYIHVYLLFRIAMIN